MSVEAFAEAAKKRRSKPKGGADGQPRADGREEVRLSVEEFNAIARRCAALLKDTIYLRGHLPFAITRAAEFGSARQTLDRDGEAVEIAGVRHHPGALLFVDASREHAAFQLDERVLFYRFDRRADDWLPTTCPTKLAQRIVGVASELGFRPCSGISRTPLFIAGKVIAARGWDAATRMILDPPDDLPPLPEVPSREDALTALDVLLRPFRGYLADNPTLKPTFAAAALTAALRSSLPGAPAIVLDGNSIGVGKGKAARALAVIATGTLPAVIAEGHDDEETDKRISAAILQGASTILLDNLQRPLNSTTLESILTDPIARIRKFGSLSEVVTECRALILITANNATLRRDLLRRTLPVRLVVPDDKPELRRFDFDPVDEARRGRSNLLAAALSCEKAWYAVRDHPDHAQIRAKTLGSFETWAALVAGAVEWLTGANPIDTIEDRKDSDTSGAAERGLILQLAETFPGLTFTAAEAAQKLPAEAWSACLSFKGDKPTGRAVGNWLKRRQDRRFRICDADGAPLRFLTLEMGKPDRKGFAAWSLKPESADFHSAPDMGKNNGLGEAPNGRRTASPPRTRTVSDTFQNLSGNRSAPFGHSAPTHGADDPGIDL